MPDVPWGVLFWHLKSHVQVICFALLFLYSLAGRAAAPERILSGVLCAMFVVDRLYHEVSPEPIVWRHTDLMHLCIDTVVLACTLAVALHANRVYPLWIGAAQIIAVSGHAYRVSMMEINRFAYDMMVMMPSYVQLVAMALGLAFHTWRRRRRGSYPSWRRSSSHTPPVMRKISRGA